MSIIASNHVWTLKGLTSSERVLLLALADSHNKETGQCNPSHKKVAEKTHWTERNVKRLVKQCEQKGVLSVHRTKIEARKNAANKYSFPGSGGDKFGNEKSSGGDKLGKKVVTSSAKTLTQPVTQNRKIEPEDRTGNPADSPQGVSGTNTKEIPRKVLGKVYSAWEEGLRGHYQTVPVLSGKEKGQLKKAAKEISELGCDPAPVLRKVAVEWRRFGAFVQGAGVGFTVAARPDTGQVLKWSRQCVEYFREKELRAAQDSAWQAEQNEARAKSEAKEKARIEAQAKQDKLVNDYMLTDPAYSDIMRRKAKHEAQASLPDFGMSEADCVCTMFDGELIVPPEQAWKQQGYNLRDELSDYLLKSKLRERAEAEAMKHQGINIGNVPAIANESAA